MFRPCVYTDAGDDSPIFRPWMYIEVQVMTIPCFGPVYIERPCVYRAAGDDRDDRRTIDDTVNNVPEYGSLSTLNSISIWRRSQRNMTLIVIAFSNSYWHLERYCVRIFRERKYTELGVIGFRDFAIIWRNSQGIAVKAVSFEYGINCTSDYIFQFISNPETFLYEFLFFFFFEMENERNG
jgi:hypothetical protein